MLRLNNNVWSFDLNIGKDHSPCGRPMGHFVVGDWQPRSFCHQTWHYRTAKSLSKCTDWSWCFKQSMRWCTSVLGGVIFVHADPAPPLETPLLHLWRIEFAYCCLCMLIAAVRMITFDGFVLSYYRQLGDVVPVMILTTFRLLESCTLTK